MADRGESSPNNPEPGAEGSQSSNTEGSQSASNLRYCAQCGCVRGIDPCWHRTRDRVAPPPRSTPPPITYYSDDEEDEWVFSSDDDDESSTSDDYMLDEGRNTVIGPEALAALRQLEDEQAHLAERSSEARNDQEYDDDVAYEEYPNDEEVISEWDTPPPPYARYDPFDRHQSYLDIGAICDRWITEEANDQLLEWTTRMWNMEQDMQSQARANDELPRYSRWDALTYERPRA